MIARERHISTRLVLTLDAGQVNGKKATKRVTISGLREDVSADAIGELARALEKLLEHPVDTIKIHRVSAIERVEENGESAENAAEAVGMAGLQVNGAAAGMENARPDGHAAARAFGGVDNNRQLGRSYKAAYLKGPQLSVCRLHDYAGDSYALSPSPRTVRDGAAIRSATPLVCTRPPPGQGRSRQKTGLPPPRSAPGLPRAKAAVVIIRRG